MNKHIKGLFIFISCLAITGSITFYQKFSNENKLNDSKSLNNTCISSDYNMNASHESAINYNQSANLACDSQIITNADFAVIYNDIDMLKKESSIVVEGEIVDTDVFKYKVNDEAVPYTIYKLKVSKTFVGDVNEGDIVNIAEYGGVITADEAGLDNKFPNMSEEEKNQKIGFSFGVPLSIKGEKIICFGCNKNGYQILDYDEDYYMLINEYQGKFVYNSDENSYSRIIPNTKSEISTLKIKSEDLEMILKN